VIAIHDCYHSIEEVVKDHELVLDHAGTMQQCSTHILSVITNMLNLAKLTEGKMVIEQETFDLRECARSIDMICKPLVRNGVELRVIFEPPSLARMEGDAVLIKQWLGKLHVFLRRWFLFHSHGVLMVACVVLAQSIWCATQRRP
jgi:hypothetical protein